jgi:8-oxo-(d)GTP phosphatase
MRGAVGRVVCYFERVAGRAWTVNFPVDPVPPEFGAAARSDYGQSDYGQSDAEQDFGRGGYGHGGHGRLEPESLLRSGALGSKSGSDGKVAVRAAGAVVWRPGRRGPEIALIHRPRYGDWSFPKGKLDPGEGWVVAAVREVFEETGFPVILGRRLPTQLYDVSLGGPRRMKKVKYWAAQAAADVEFQPNEEVDRLEWLSIPQALRRLTRSTDADLLESFAAAPVATTPVILLRHATALARKHWRGGDIDRPLTAVGQDEAQTLIPLLSAYGDAVLVTSNAVRCVETLEPFAKDAGSSLIREPRLYESVGDSGRSGAVSWLRETLAADQATVGCTHRPVLPGMLASSTAGAAVHARRRALSPGEAWVLHAREGTVVAIDRLKGA